MARGQNCKHVEDGCQAHEREAHWNRTLGEASGRVSPQFPAASRTFPFPRPPCTFPREVREGQERLRVEASCTSTSPDLSAAPPETRPARRQRLSCMRPLTTLLSLKALNLRKVPCTIRMIAGRGRGWARSPVDACRCRASGSCVVSFCDVSLRSHEAVQILMGVHLCELRGGNEFVILLSMFITGLHHRHRGSMSPRILSDH
jgi:hypothetical protein